MGVRDLKPGSYLPFKKELKAEVHGSSGKNRSIDRGMVRLHGDRLGDSEREAKEIINILTKNNFHAECPCCNETIRLKDAHLFYRDDFPPEAEKLYQSMLDEHKEREESLREMPRRIASGSETSAKATNIGLILERIAPSMNNFPFVYNDCRSLFEPIDYIIFEGLSRKGLVERIVFAEVKTGKSRLNARQWEIRSLVEQKHVYWSTYKIGERK